MLENHPKNIKLSIPNKQLKGKKQLKHILKELPALRNQRLVIIENKTGMKGKTSFIREMEKIYTM